MAEEWVLKVCHCFHRALPNSVGGMVDKHFNILLSPNLYRMLWVRLTCFHAEAAPRSLRENKEVRECPAASVDWLQWPLPLLAWTKRFSF